MSTPTYRRYVGGTRNLDGAVTRTVGVTATSAYEAQTLIAERLSKYETRPLAADEIGIVRSFGPENGWIVTIPNDDGNARIYRGER